ncbi:MoaD/ThiS family protein [Mobiluncus curtisii]|uniref:MoaD/ThiS family protein n=1 Tax=Mobiluncus curtisii TaxID=2051 RepID=UPI00147021F7|nr:MoaD/ThiS family protein [Mobiluncus curtisii]MCV0021684.1 MoaD/ThiS family protein [Mobiluncus curtisii]NMW47203.1 MoaD/ThiS family protein [Mobiluncus curtisii]
MRENDGDTVAVQVRFFAAAAEAAGADVATVQVVRDSSVAETAAQAGGCGSDLNRVLSVSSYLVGGLHEPGQKKLADFPDLTNLTIDVLPPFAGG